jgi:hypothetical protein
MIQNNVKKNIKFEVRVFPEVKPILLRSSLFCSNPIILGIILTAGTLSNDMRFKEKLMKLLQVRTEMIDGVKKAPVKSNNISN